MLTFRVKDASRYWWEARCTIESTSKAEGTCIWSIALYRDDVLYDTLYTQMPVDMPLINTDVARAIGEHFCALAVTFAAYGQQLSTEGENDE